MRFFPTIAWCIWNGGLHILKGIVRYSKKKIYIYIYISKFVVCKKKKMVGNNNVNHHCLIHLEYLIFIDLIYLKIM